jgi:phospholipase C
MVAMVGALLVLVPSCRAPFDSAQAGPCGSTATPVPIRHVIVVMLENRSYKQVVGSPDAPYETSLATHCGVATAMFGATHDSAANYLAVSAGEYPAASRRGCSSVGACADSSDNLYHQLAAAKLSWRGYEESMPRPCDGASEGTYKIGHNPAIFYRNISHSACLMGDVPIANLSATSGSFYDALQTQTLPSFSWVTPDKAHDGEGSSDAATALNQADTWLAGFTALVEQSASYRSGNTLVLITYDEGFGHDERNGEDCTNAALDLPVVNGISAHQDSCHIPFFVVYPYTPAGAADGTFFDHYSVTKTVEDVFSLPHLAHAADAQTATLIGHFGIP